MPDQAGPPPSLAPRIEPTVDTAMNPAEARLCAMNRIKVILRATCVWPDISLAHPVPVAGVELVEEDLAVVLFADGFARFLGQFDKFQRLGLIPAHGMRAGQRL